MRKEKGNNNICFGRARIDCFFFVFAVRINWGGDGVKEQRNETTKQNKNIIIAARNDNFKNKKNA